MKKSQTVLKIICIAASVLFYIITVSLFLAAVLCTHIGVWFHMTFGVSFEQILFTIASPLKGADTNFLKSAVTFVKPYMERAACISLLCIAFDVLVIRRMDVRLEFILGRRQTYALSVYPLSLFRPLLLAIVIGLCVSTGRYVDSLLKIREYVTRRMARSTIFEQYYVPPESVAISTPAQRRNLIHIYMESMETTYAAAADGGWQSGANYIPRLTGLSRDAVAFKGIDGSMSGLHSCTGTGWTMAALFSMTSGVPFKFPVDGNTMNTRKSFAPGLTALGDLLKAQGYAQEFICGSDGNFAGRKDYFVQHGGYEVFDLFTARERGYIPEGYSVWWGFEDEVLYRIARDEASRLAAEGGPFNLTLLTVDTHHVGGYVCPLCGSEYDVPLANVVACADRQVAEFVDWCREQEWFADTVIVITGDHPRMDSILVDGVSYYDRSVYNCFVNAVPHAAQMDGRIFMPMDIFPTVLSALGFQFEGNRLGLGTDLFSARPTLAEELGYTACNEELAKYSQYFIDEFLKAKE